MSDQTSTVRMAEWLEQVWVERYLARVLNLREIAWFEAYMIDKLELLDMIEADIVMRDGIAEYVHLTDDQSAIENPSHLEELAPNPYWMPNTQARLIPYQADSVTMSQLGSIDQSANYSRSEMLAAKKVHPASSKNTNKARFNSTWFSMAASLGLGCVLGSQWIARDDAPTYMTPDRIVFDTFRGADLSPMIEGRSDSEWLLAEFAVPNEAENIQLLIGEKSFGLQAGNEGFASIVLNKKLLRKTEQMKLSFNLDKKAQSMQIEMPISTNGAKQ